MEEPSDIYKLARAHFRIGEECVVADQAGKLLRHGPEAYLADPSPEHVVKWVVRHLRNIKLPPSEELQRELERVAEEVRKEREKA